MTGRLRQVPAARANRQVSIVLLVMLEHLGVIHFVNMVARQNDDVLRLFLFDGVNVLVHRVCRTLVPVLVNPLLGRHDINELAKLATEEFSPAKIDVAIEAHGFVLSQHEGPTQTTVEAIRKHKVDDAVRTTKRNCRLGPIPGQRFQSRTFPSSQYHSQAIIHSCSSTSCPK